MAAPIHLSTVPLERTRKRGGEDRSFARSVARGTSRVVPILVLLATVGLGPNWAKADGMEVPFRGSWTGAVGFTSPSTVAFNGTGNAAQLGLSTNQGVATIFHDDSSCSGGKFNENVETFTAANGDTLQITSEDVACPIRPGVYHGHGSYYVSGGTGRFTNASGGGTLDGQSDFTTGQFTFQATGTLSVPPSGS